MPDLFMISMTFAFARHLYLTFSCSAMTQKDNFEDEVFPRLLPYMSGQDLIIAILGTERED